MLVICIFYTKKQETPKREFFYHRDEYDEEQYFLNRQCLKVAFLYYRTRSH